MRDLMRIGLLLSLPFLLAVVICRGRASEAGTELPTRADDLDRSMPKECSALLAAGGNANSEAVGLQRQAFEGVLRNMRDIRARENMRLECERSLHAPD